MKQRGEGYFNLNEPKEVPKEKEGHLFCLQYYHKVPMIIQASAILHVPVNPEALQRAIEISLFVHPLLRLCQSVRDGKLFEFYSDFVPPIFHDEGTKDRGVLCAKDRNPYQFRVGYEESTIRFTLSHDLTDGRGSLVFFNTLLYYYFKEAGLFVSPDSSVVTLETPFCAQELEDTLDIIQNLPPSTMLSERRPNAFLLSKFLLKPLGSLYSRHEIRFKTSELLLLASSTESSPISVLFPIFAQAILRLQDNPQQLPLTFPMMIDLRAPFHSMTIKNCSHSVFINYYPHMVNLPLSQQATMIRGQIDLILAYPEYFHGNVHTDANRIASTMQRTQEVAPGYVLPNLSNIGKISIPDSMMSHLQTINFDAFTEILPIYSGITSLGDETCFFMNHRLADTSIIDMMITLLKEYGISPKLIDCGEQPIPSILFE